MNHTLKSNFLSCKFLTTRDAPDVMPSENSENRPQVHSFPSMFLSILVALAPLSGCQAKNQETVLVTEEGTTAPLIVAKNAPPHTIEAVEELARLLEKISGHRPEILNVPPDPLPASTIWVGPHPGLAKAMPGVDFQLTQPEETLYVSQGGHVAILGKDKMVGDAQIMSGTANAVYSFAQEVLGVRWLWPGELGEDIIASKTIRVPAQSVRFTPIFLERRLFHGNIPALVQPWNVRQRLAYDSLQTPAGHDFKDWWEKYSKTHPEYFALQPDGTRSGFPNPHYAKVCEGEPGVARQWLENVAEQLERNPTQRTFNAQQNDGADSGICVDPRSKAMDEPDAPLQRYAWKDKTATDVAMSDRMVRFANKLGELLEKRFPDEDLKVVNMAYGPSKPAPMKAVPRDNVVISYVGQFPTSGDKWREMEKAQYAAWAKTAPFMVFRPNLFYYSGGWHGLPVITPHLVAEDFRFLADHSCRGITVDGTPNHFGTQGLQYYVMAQLIWNPYQDVDALVDDFCLRGFGPAASEIRAYYDLMEQAQLAVLNHPEWFPGMRTTRDPLSEAILPGAYSPELLAKADEKLARAAKALEKAPEVYRQRLDFLQRSQEFTRLIMDTVLTMNDVRQSKGQNVEAVEKAVALVEAREKFFREEEVRAKAAGRPTVVYAHRIRNTWIETRKLENWLGPVSEEFLLAAAAAKKAGVPVTPAPEERKASQTAEVPMTVPATLRWTGAAGDGAWQNRKNWEALSAANKWVSAPSPPQDGARVEFGDAVARPGPQVLQLALDVKLESITVNAAVPTNTYKIKNREDVDGGIDADSARVFALTLTGTSPIIQPARTQADADFEVPVHLAHPEIEKDLRSEHNAKIRFLKAVPGGKTGPHRASQEAGKRKPEILGNGPLVLFGDSTTAPRGDLCPQSPLRTPSRADSVRHPQKQFPSSRPETLKRNFLSARPS